MELLILLHIYILPEFLAVDVLTSEPLTGGFWPEQDPWSDPQFYSKGMEDTGCSPLFSF